MSFENEHRARLRNPKDFDPKSYRRTEGGKLYNKIKVPNTISIIWAKLKGKSKPKDPPLPQALAFPTKHWTAAAAKSWLTKNKVKHIRFEAAKKKNKQSLSDDDTAPVKACVLNEKAEVLFTDGDGESNKFRIVGYSGGIIKGHWFWGNLAIDLKGTKFYKKRLAVLESHFTASRIGFTTKQKIDGNVTFEGEFLDNDKAQEIRADIKKGFPMEASLFCWPSVIERVQEGANVKVNGLTLKGPGAVFRKSVIKEVSMCVFGSDINTKSSALADNENVKFNLLKEHNIMEDQTTEITSLEELNEQHPDLSNELFEKGKTEGLAEGERKQKAYFEALKAACGSDNELVVKCFTEQVTTEKASQLRIAKLEDTNKQLTENKNQQTEQTETAAVDPAVTEFTDQTPDPESKTKTESDDDKLKAEFQASEELQAEFGGDEKAYLSYMKAEVAGQVR